MKRFYITFLGYRKNEPKVSETLKEISEGNTQREAHINLDTLFEVKDIFETKELQLCDKCNTVSILDTSAFLVCSCKCLHCGYSDAEGGVC